MEQEPKPEYRKWLNLERLQETETKTALTQHINTLTTWLETRLKDPSDARRGITRFLTHTKKPPNDITLHDYAAYMEYIYNNRTQHPSTLANYMTHLKLHMKFTNHTNWTPLIRLPFATRTSTQATQITASPQTEQLAQDVWNDWLNTELIPMQRTPRTIKLYKHIILPTIRLLNKHPKDMTKQDLYAIVQHMTKKNCKPQTINNNLTVLKRLCEFHENTIAFKAWKPLTQESPVRRCPNKAQIETILQAAKNSKQPYLYPFMMTLGFTGLRITTVCNITIEDLDLDNRYIRKTTKGKKLITSPINKDYLLPALIQHITDNNITYGHLWLNSHGHPVKPWMVRKFLQSIANEVGYWSPHDFRRGIATLLYRQSNYDLKFVQKFLGHTSIDITAKYIGIDDQELKNRYDSIISTLDFNV